MVFDEWMLFFDEYSGYRKIIGGCFDPFCLFLGISPGIRRDDISGKRINAGYNGNR